MNRSGFLCLGSFASVLALVLLYIALFLAPEVYHLYPPYSSTSSSSPSTNRPQDSSDMTIKVHKFTPEVLLSAPRRSAAIPNDDGTLALYTVSTYSFESRTKTKEIRILDLRTSQSTLVTNDEKASDPHWLEGEILYLKAGEKNSTQLMVTSADDVGKSYSAGSVPGPVSDVKLKVLEKGKVALVCTGTATPDGKLYNPENEPKRRHTGKLYDSLMVRHWDSYVTPNTNALFYGLLQVGKPHATEKKGKYSLSTLTNALKDTKIESPMGPFPSSSHYDIGANGIIFVAKDPNVDPAFNTKCNFYYLSISDFGTGSSSKLQNVEIKELEGASSSPVFSPDGRSAAFLQMKTNGYESDKNRIIVVPSISEPGSAFEVFKSTDGKGSWDRSPSSLLWSNDGRKLFTIAGDEGNELLFQLDLPTSGQDTTKPPTKLTTSGTVSEVQPLGSTSKSLLLSGSSLIDPSIFYTLDPENPSSLTTISSTSRNGTSFNLSRSQISSIWFTGSASNTKVHAWVLKPSSFDSSKTYPLAYLIHGGPQGAWSDSWSTRWNPAVFAEAGYVVVTPNPTGSTSYGQAFTDAIQNNWGGAPYEDLVAGFTYIKENMPFVDTTRAVALGASYGGYMMNWMQGHPLSREFKALVCHDGVFSLSNQLSSDEQYFPNHDLGGPFWRATANYDKWDPARHTGNWETPMLVIHNEKDYRLPISEGLAAFNVLQERGIESRFLSFPDENHWVLKEENSLAWHRVVLGWINKFVGLPKPEGEEVEVWSQPWGKKGKKEL